MAAVEAGIKTFLIADVRGYTRYTNERGDEAAARLATRFAELAREAIEAAGGTLVELRGDEALAVFDSARQALRAAADLQERFVAETVADPSLPLAVGIGLDAGEAVPVDGGYRGGALNLAARLCSLAGPGEVLVSPGVAHLARKVEGLDYVERGPVRLKGLEKPVEVVAVRPEREDVARELAFRRALDPGAAGGLEGRNPYKGLRPFAENDAEDFFGREALTEHLLERLAQTRFLAVVGPSGSGKSSVVRAGLVPRLRQGALPGSDRWHVAEMFPGAYPLEELEAALLRTADSAPSGVLEQLERNELGLLRAVKQLLADDESELVLVVDQLEEAFTLVEDEGRRTQFLALLERAVTDPHARLRVVVTLRADFYDRPLLYSGFAELLRDYVEALVPLRAEEFERAIAGPAERVGARFEPGLLAELVTDVSDEPGALPLLQYALTELYERREGSTLTRDAYHAMGGVSGALAGRAEEIFSGLGELAQEAARQLFLRLVTLGEGAEDTRRRAERTELASMEVDQAALEEAIQEFGAWRLLSFDRDPRSGAPTIEVAHEALMREWARFRRWIDSGREEVRLHRRLAAAAREWEEAGRESSYLLRGSNLAQFEALAGQSTIALTELEREFVEASTAANELELERQRRQNRRLRTLLAGAVGLLLLAVVAGAIALVSRSNAQHEAKVALGRELGAEAVSEPRIDIAMLLAAEAVKLDDSRQTQGTLLSTLLRSPAALSTFSSPITDRPQQIGLSPDGRTLAVVENTDFMRFYDTKYRKERLALPDALHQAPTFSRDGKLIFLFRAKAPPPAPQFLEIRDAKTLRHLRWLPTDKLWQDPGPNLGTGYQSPLLVSPDDRHAYFAWTLVSQSTGEDLQAYVDKWDVRTGKLQKARVDAKGMFAARLAGGKLELVADDRVVTLDAATLQQVATKTLHFEANSADWEGALSPDGRTIIFGSSATGAVSFVDLSNGRVTTGTGKTGVGVQDVGFSPTGRVAVSTDENGHVTVWNPRTAEVVDTFTGHEDRTLGLTFSADGKTLYTCSLDGAIFAWDLSGKRRFGHPFAFNATNPQTLNAPPVQPLAVSSDSREFATRLQGLTVGIFGVSSLKREASFTIPFKNADAQSAVDALAWSPRAPLLAVASSDGSMDLWNVAGKPRLVRALHVSQAQSKNQPVYASEIAFSPDGTRLLEGGFENTPKTKAGFAGVADVWRVSDGKLAWSAFHPGWSTDAVAISADGRMMALTQSLRKTDMTQLVNASTGTVERTIHPLEPLGDAIALAFSSDGRLETGTYGGVVQSWDSRTGKELGHPVLAMPAPVSSLAFQPGTDVFAAGGGSGGFVKLWDANTQTEIGSALPGSPGEWASSEFTPDGSKLVTIYTGGRGAVWPVRPTEWTAQACKVAGRNFSPEEWRRFVGGRSYSEVCPQYPVPSG
jgi:WD40 repeat protein/class 3 adenylate cyclase